MATYTTNYNLEKPAQTDIYNVDVFNDNADKVDAALTDKAEKTMLAPVESTNKASRAYAVGEYFVFGGYLCRATAAIASGGTIAIGTNCASTAVGTELSSLKESLSPLFIRALYTYTTYSMSASSGINLSPDNSPVPSGYVPILAELVSTGNLRVGLRGYNTRNGQIFLINDTTSTQSVSPSMAVWCVRSSVISE